MNTEFNKHVDKLPGLLEQLKKSPLKPRSNLGDLPRNGVYVFYESGRPIYVGRSNRMKDRIMEHGRLSSTHGSAPFAFNLAKEDAEKKGININKPRAELSNELTFANLFSESKERVKRMSVRVIKIDNQITQTLFEVYASIALKTTKYNSFDTH